MAGADDVVKAALKLVMGAGEEAAPKAAIRAYHASPHDFDKFEWSPRTFGTGEGAQSYGAGLYFAESPLVSGRGGTYDQQFTRKLLELDKSGGDTRMNRLKIGDQPLTSYGVEYDPEFIEAVKSGNEFRYAQNRLDRWHELSGDEAYPYRDYALEKMQAWEKLLNDMHSGKSAYYPTKSRIYEVDINARPTQLLDWDAPIKEQSGEIQRAVGNLPVNRPLSNYSVIGEPVQIDPYPNAPPALKAKLVALDGGVPYTVSVRTPEGGIVKIKGATPEEALSNANEYAGKAVKDLMSRTGGDLVKSLERGDYSIPDRTAKLNATGSLYKEGIPGLRYLDAGSRSGNVADPTRNYVIWNDQLIDLKKKYEHGGRIAKGPGGWVDDVVKMAGKVISGEGEDAAKAGIRAYQGSPHNFAAERLVRFPEGRTEYIVGQPDVLPDVPEGAEVVQDFPLGRMRMDKIGTGEGAQAYGHGLYYAEHEPVATGYRRSLAGPESMGTVTFDGRPIVSKGSPAEGWDDPNLILGKNIHARDLAETMLRHNGDVDAAVSELRGKSQSALERAQTIKNEKLRQMAIDSAKTTFDMADLLQANPDRYGVKVPGSMYEVRINADPDTFLDWDKPLSEQGGVDRFAKLPGFARPLDAEEAENLTGQRLHQRLANKLGEGGASSTLREAGIPGIKYLDAGSRVPSAMARKELADWQAQLSVAERELADATARGDKWLISRKQAEVKRVQDGIARVSQEAEGTRNYVVFDDKLISIIRKYGIAGASAMLGYNLMEQLDPKQALAASMADQDYQASRPQRSMGGNNSISGALNVARGLNGVK